MIDGLADGRSLLVRPRSAEAEQIERVDLCSRLAWTSILNHIDQDAESVEERFQSFRKNFRGLVAEVVEQVIEDLEGRGRRAR